MYRTCFQRILIVKDYTMACHSNMLRIPYGVKIEEDHIVDLNFSAAIDLH